MSETTQDENNIDIDIDNTSNARDVQEQAIDPSWFESPAEGLSTSGGTAAFYKLKLTDKGLEEVVARQTAKGNNDIEIDRDYWIGKDLSHAADEKDFYLTILRTRNEHNNNNNNNNSTSTNSTTSIRDLTEGIGLVEAFMFDYLGVLSTKTTTNTTTNKEELCNLLVMRNMRNKFQNFRMLDLKIGEKTAQAGWKGKSRMSAVKHVMMDGLSNSASEGYRLAGFNGCPEVFDSMDPLQDILSTDCLESETKTKTETHSETISGWKTLWGSTIEDSEYAQAKRFMLNSLGGTGAFRYFYDLHMDGISVSSKDESENNGRYLPIEVAEIVSHELTSQLIQLATACHKMKIPQKWIGSSVAVAFDAGFFPHRRGGASESEDEQQGRSPSPRPETMIRSKVLCKIFDWGRSELLTAEQYDAMTVDEQADRQSFWELYKVGIDRLSYNATRFYYHQFTKTTLYSDITIEVYDFDSMSADDYMGKVVIDLPDPSNEEALKALEGTRSKTYKLKGMMARSSSTLTCSIQWEDFPQSSRLKGAWKVLIEKAENLPGMDVPLRLSDPYCMVRGNAKHREDGGQHFCQRTCVKARNLDPIWNETIVLPVARPSIAKDALESMLGTNASCSSKAEISDRFQWDKYWFRGSKSNMHWWTTEVLDRG